MAPAMTLALAASFGSVQHWRDEFVALGKALAGGSGWVLLSYLPREGRLVNQWAADHAHAIAGAVPVLALDMYEHAYHLDHGAAAGVYVDAFMGHIDWAGVYQRYQSAVHGSSEAFGAAQHELGDAVLVDVRRAAVFEAAGTMIAGSTWRDPALVAQWADSALFWVAVPMTVQMNGPVGIFPQATPEFLKAFGADRASMSAGARRPGLHDTRVQLSNYLGWIEQQLGDGRPFVLGSLACIADFSMAQSVWFMHLSSKVAALLQPYPKLLAWYARMKAFGHGTHDELSSTDALAIAAAATSTAACSVDPALGLDAGAEVTVNALDYGADPVAGTLVGLSQHEVVVARRDERAGTVHVHFPRIGFQIKMEKRP